MRDELKRPGQRQNELRRLSVHSADTAIAEEEGSQGQRGRLLGRAWLNDEAFVEVHEVVQVVDNHITREKYAYFLCIGSDEIGGYERDPTHDPAEHRHCSHREEHESAPAEAVSFRQAIEEAWQYLGGLYPEGDD